MEVIEDHEGSRGKFQDYEENNECSGFEEGFRQWVECLQSVLPESQPHSPVGSVQRSVGLFVVEQGFNSIPVPTWEHDSGFGTGLSQ